MLRVPTKRQFTDELKREAVALWQTSGRLQTEVAREIGIQPTMLRRWKEKIEAGGAPPPGATAASPRPAALPSPADRASEIARLKRELERVKMERDVLKARSAFCRDRRLRPRGGAEVKYAFIREQAGCFPVRLMCRVLGVSPSGYYEWRDRPESSRAAAKVVSGLVV